MKQKHFEVQKHNGFQLLMIIMINHNNHNNQISLKSAFSENSLYKGIELIKSIHMIKTTNKNVKGHTISRKTHFLTFKALLFCIRDLKAGKSVQSQMCLALEFQRVGAAIEKLLLP